MKYRKVKQIKVVDSKTPEAFEREVNEALAALDSGESRVTDYEQSLELLRAVIRYEKGIMEPENDFERRTLAGEKVTCATCAYCKKYSDKRKKPRCEFHGFRVEENFACEKFRERREEDGERVPARQAG